MFLTNIQSFYNLIKREIYLFHIREQHFVIFMIQYKMSVSHKLPFPSIIIHFFNIDYNYERCAFSLMPSSSSSPPVASEYFFLLPVTKKQVCLPKITYRKLIIILQLLFIKASYHLLFPLIMWLPLMALARFRYRHYWPN